MSEWDAAAFVAEVRLAGLEEAILNHPPLAKRLSVLLLNVDRGVCSADRARVECRRSFSLDGATTDTHFYFWALNRAVGTSSNTLLVRVVEARWEVDLHRDIGCAYFHMEPGRNVRFARMFARGAAPG